MDEPCDVVVGALARRFGFEVRKKDVRSNQLRLLGRVPPAQARNWVVFRKHMLEMSMRKEWTYDGSRQDILRGGALVWGWRLIFQHDALESYFPEIVDVINSCPRAKFEVEEQPLPGVTGQRRIMNARGKGASSAGSVPLIVQQRAGGGVVR